MAAFRTPPRCTSRSTHYGFVLYLRGTCYTLRRLSPVNVTRCRVASISRHNNSYSRSPLPPQSLPTPHRCTTHLHHLPASITSPPTLDVGGATCPHHTVARHNCQTGHLYSCSTRIAEVLAAFEQIFQHRILIVRRSWPMRRVAPRRGSSRSTSILLCFASGITLMSLLASASASRSR